MGIRIINGRVIDPADQIDRVADLYVDGGCVVAWDEAPSGFTADTLIDATGLIVCPGFVDLRARLREPGQEHKGTVASETRAAAAAGITTLCCPPDTTPVIDTPAVAEMIRRRAHDAGYTRVLPLAALTLGLEGEQLSEMYALRQAGCVAMSNARHPVTNTLVMRYALEYLASLDLPVILYSEDPWLGGSGCVHEGAVSTRLGLPGVPACAEVIGVSRDLLLVEQAGVRAHFGPLSTARAVEMVAEAQQKGLSVTADVAAHQLFLTDTDIREFDTLCHVRPPLRSQRDRDGLRAALADGVIAAICSDHQPHDRDAKLAPFAASEPGIASLETLLPLTLRLVDEAVLPLMDAIAAITWHPAQVLGIDAGRLAPGAPADICIFDPNRHWEVTEEALVSLGKNTPFVGWEMKGRVAWTLLEGRVVHRPPP